MNDNIVQRTHEFKPDNTCKISNGLNLQKNSDEAIKRLREKVEYEIYRIIRAIKDELTSRRFLDW